MVNNSHFLRPIGHRDLLDIQDMADTTAMDTVRVIILHQGQDILHRLLNRIFLAVQKIKAGKNTLAATVLVASVFDITEDVLRPVAPIRLIARLMDKINTDVMLRFTDGPAISISRKNLRCTTAGTTTPITAALFSATNIKMWFHVAIADNIVKG